MIVIVFLGSLYNYYYEDSHREKLRQFTFNLVTPQQEWSKPLYRKSTYRDSIHMFSFHDNLILMMLAKKEMYGYELMKSLTEFTSGLYEPTKSGTLYPALKRLEDRGLITSEMREHEGNTLKYYRITEKGKNRLERMWTMVSRIEEFRSKIGV